MIPQLEEVEALSEAPIAAAPPAVPPKLNHEQICEALSDGVIRAGILAILEKGRHRNHHGLEDALQRAIEMALGHTGKFSSATHLKYWIHASAVGNMKRQYQDAKDFDTPGTDQAQGDFLDRAATQASSQRWNGRPYVAHSSHDYTSRQDYAIDLKTCIARATSSRALRDALWGHVFLGYKQNDDALYEKCGKGRQFGKVDAASQRSFINALQDAKKELNRQLTMAGYFDEADALLAAKVYPWLAQQPRAWKPLKHGGWRHPSNQLGLAASKPTGASDWTCFPHGYANFLQQQAEGTFNMTTITERQEEPEVVRPPIDSEYSRAWAEARESLLDGTTPKPVYAPPEGWWSAARRRQAKKKAEQMDPVEVT